MNDVEKLIAKLIDEHKITGEEAVVLIKSCKSDYSISSDDLWKGNPIKTLPNLTPPNSNITWDNSNYFTRDLGNGISMAQ